MIIIIMEDVEAVVIQVVDGNNKKNGYCNLNAIAIFLILLNHLNIEY